MDHPLLVEIGSGLVHEVDPNQEGHFLQVLQYARLSLAVYKRKELPPVHIEENNDLDEMSFRYAYYDVVFYEGVLKKSWHLYKTLRRMIKRIPAELVDVDDSFISAKFVSFGKLVVERDEVEVALEYFEKAIKYNENNSDAYKWSGYCHQTLEQFEKAISDYSTVVDLGECSAWLYRQRALCYEKVSMFKHAIADNEMAFAIELQDQ
jgi:tetratricopeptide (TPR) repeat protein